MKIDSRLNQPTITPRRTTPQAASTGPVEQYDSAPREGGFLSLRHLADASIGAGVLGGTGASVGGHFGSLLWSAHPTLGMLAGGATGLAIGGAAGAVCGIKFFDAFWSTDSSSKKSPAVIASVATAITLAGAAAYIGFTEPESAVSPAQTVSAPAEKQGGGSYIHSDGSYGIEVGGITSHSDGTQSVQIGGATVKSNGKVEVPLTKHLTVDSDGEFKWNWF